MGPDEDFWSKCDAFRLFWRLDKYSPVLCVGVFAINCNTTPTFPKIFQIKAVENNLSSRVIQLNSGKNVSSRQSPQASELLLFILPYEIAKTKLYFVCIVWDFVTQLANQKFGIILGNVANVYFLLLLTLKLPTSTSQTFIQQSSSLVNPVHTNHCITVSGIVRTTPILK